MKCVSCVAVAMMLIFIGGCGSQSGVKISFDTKEYITDTLDIKAEIPKFSGVPNHDFESRLNTEYENNINVWIEEFMNSTLEDVKSEFYLKQNVKYNDCEFVSMVSEVYTFLGGAHGSTEWKTGNIDMRESKQVMLGDLFLPDSDYRTVLERIVQSMAESDKDKYGDLWEQPKISDKQEKDFYIQDGKLVIYYSPYELSYYAKGFVEFPIKLTDIQSYMKEDYKRLLQ